MGTPYIAMYPSDYLADTAHLGQQQALAQTAQAPA